MGRVLQKTEAELNREKMKVEFDLVALLIGLAIAVVAIAIFSCTCVIIRNVRRKIMANKIQAE